MNKKAFRFMQSALAVLMIASMFFAPLDRVGIQNAYASDGLAQVRVYTQYPIVEIQITGVNQDNEYKEKTAFFSSEDNITEFELQNWWCRFTYDYDFDWFGWFGEYPDDSGPMIWVRYADSENTLDVLRCEEPEIERFQNWVDCYFGEYDSPGEDGGESGGGIEFLSDPICETSSIAARISWETNEQVDRGTIYLDGIVDLAEGDYYQTATYHFGGDENFYETPMELFPGIEYRIKLQLYGENGSFAYAELTCPFTKPGKLDVDLIDLNKASLGYYETIDEPEFNTPGNTKIHWRQKTSSFGVGTTLGAQVGVRALVNTSYADCNSDSCWVSVDSLTQLPPITYGVGVESGGLYVNQPVSKSAVADLVSKKATNFLYGDEISDIYLPVDGITPFSYVPPFALETMSDTLSVWPTSASSPTIDNEGNIHEKYIGSSIDIRSGSNLVMQGCFVVGGAAENPPPSVSQTAPDEGGCNNEQITDEIYRKLKDDEGLFDYLKHTGDLEDTIEDTVFDVIGIIPIFGDIKGIFEVVSNVRGFYDLHNSIQSWYSAGAKKFPGEGRSITLFNGEELHAVTYQVYSMAGAVEDKASLTNHLWEFRENVLYTPRLYYVIYTIRDVEAKDTRAKIYEGVVAGPPQWLIQAAEDKPAEPYCSQCDELLKHGSIVDIYQDVKEYRQQLVSNSPIHYWVELENGQRIGTLADGTPVNDGVPGEYYTFPEYDGTISEAVMTQLGEHDLHIVGTENNADFTLAITQFRESNQIIGFNYVDVPVNLGQELTVSLSPTDYPRPIIAPNGDEYWPHGICDAVYDPSEIDKLIAAITYNKYHSAPKMLCLEGNAITGENVFDFDEAIQTAYGLSALPDVTGDITLLANDIVLQWSGAEDDARIITVADVGKLRIVGLENVLLQNGRMDEQFGGGAIYNAGELIFHNVEINGNASDFDGGGVVNAGKMSVEEDSTLVVKNNVAALQGGGIFNTEIGETVLANTTIKTNAAHEGGGIANEGLIWLLSGSHVLDNDVQNVGGGLYNFNSGRIYVDGATVETNTATKGAGLYNMDDAEFYTVNATFATNDGTSHGGGVYVEDGLVDIQTSTVLENDANVGGGFYANGGLLRITDSELRANIANTGGSINITNKGVAEVIRGEITDHDVRDGGAILNAGELSITGTVITDNIANNGAGIFMPATGVSSVSGVTFVDNSGTNGAGIYNRGDMSVYGSLFQNNTARNQGGGLFNSTKDNSVELSCFVGNEASKGSGIYSGSTLLAANNYWGSENGPSEEGPGDGDGVGKRVEYDPFSAADTCSSIVAEASAIPDALPSIIAPLPEWFMVYQEENTVSIANNQPSESSQGNSGTVVTVTTTPTSTAQPPVSSQDDTGTSAAPTSTTEVAVVSKNENTEHNNQDLVVDVVPTSTMLPEAIIQMPVVELSESAEDVWNAPENDVHQEQNKPVEGTNPAGKFVALLGLLAVGFFGALNHSALKSLTAKLTQLIK